MVGIKARVSVVDEEMGRWISEVEGLLHVDADAVPCDWFGLFYGLMATPGEAVEIIANEYDLDIEGVAEMLHDLTAHYHEEG